MYFLFCQEDDGSDSVYIGEAENVQKRLIQHLNDYNAGKSSLLIIIVIKNVRHKT